jgi:xanthine dehydrogenase YagR molybdenum-binding subunit
VAESKVRIGAGDSVREVTIRHDDQDAPPWGIDAKLAVVGTDVPRVDGLAKASGGARYTSDMNRPGMAYARVVRSPHAHARVKSVDLAAAKAVPGVLAAKRIGPERVTFAGAQVAAVCAESETALDDAIAAVRVEYEVLPHVVDSTAAAVEGSPRVDPAQENRAPSGSGRRGGGQRGDPDTALAAAEAKVTAEYRTSVQDHVPLEPHGSVAEFAPDGSLTVWASTQGVASARRDAVRITGLPQSKVRVHTEFMGGGFGAKLGGDLCDQVAIEFAKETGRPVRCMNDRREEHLVAGNRPDSVQRLTIGGGRDGKITVLAGECHGSPGNGKGGADAANTVLYEIPNQGVRQASVSTFAGSARAFRAPGHPQGVFALESAVDEFAHAIGKDPLEVRRLNDRHAVRRLEWPIGAQRIGWAANRRKVPGSDPGPVKRGVGCAGGVWYAMGNKGGRDRPGYAVDVTLSPDGSVLVASGAQDIGTGTKTVLAVLVAEELGIAPSRVAVRLGDSADPEGPGSGGSTTAPSLGPAAREAGLRAKEALAAAVAKTWGVDAKDVRLEGGRVKGPGEKDASFEKACSALPPEGVRVQGQRRDNWREAFEGTTGGVQFAQVAVDVETGVVRVERVVAVHDAGRIVDTLTARNQVNGGVIQGISYALFEERRLDAGTGDMVNPTYDTYRILGMADCPEIDVVLMPMDNGGNNCGMMGLGEPATVPTAAAVANAVFNAIGVRVRTIPMTPARVLEALRSGK